MNGGKGYDYVRSRCQYIRVQQYRYICTRTANVSLLIKKLQQAVDYAVTSAKYHQHTDEACTRITKLYVLVYTKAQVYVKYRSL